MLVDKALQFDTRSL